MKSFFFSKITLHIFEVSETWKFFDFFAEKLRTIRFKKNMFEKQNHLTRFLQQIYHFQWFWKSSIFLDETDIFFQKHLSVFERFEEFYYLSRILRQICYYLVNKKFQDQKKSF